MEHNSSVGQTGGRAASLMNEIAQDVGIASGDISAADVAALNAAAVWPDLGLYLGLDDRLTALEAMDYLCTSVRAWYGFDRLGVLRMAQLTAPQEAAAAYRFQPAEILQVSRRPGDDAGAGVPAWAVKARYFRNWTVQSDSDLAGSVTAAQRQYKTQEWRNARYTDATIKNKHAQATEHEFDSAITTEGNMQTEALQRLNLLKGERSMYDVRVHLRLSMISVIELGAVVLVDFPRFGMTGRAFAIIGILHNPLGQTAELTLWG
jgi:hypothetical protein